MRLTYECNPIAFLAEQSGGKATDGHGNRILEIQPTDIHQRVPFYVGSKKMVDQAEKQARNLQVAVRPDGRTYLVHDVLPLEGL